MFRCASADIMIKVATNKTCMTIYLDFVLWYTVNEPGYTKQFMVFGSTKKHSTTQYNRDPQRGGCSNQLGMHTIRAYH